MTRNTRLVATIAAALAAAAFVAVWVLSGAAPDVRSALPILQSASPAPIFAPITSSLPDVPPPTVPPSNTALPLPEGAGAVAFTSAPIASPPPPRTPTPTPDPAVWRFEGRVVDASGAALADVCVVIGPRGCQRFSPHTDERGVYFFDVPQNPTVVYDLYFQREGFVVVWYRTQPTAPTIFNVILNKLTSRSAAGPMDL